MLRFASFGLLVLSCLFAVSPSNAQTTWRAEVEDWTFHAAASASQKRVLGFLAVSNQANVNGSNYSVIWFEPDSAGGWSSNAWVGKDLASALDYVRSTHGDESLLADHTDLIAEPVGTAAQPRSLKAGLADDDPMVDVVLAAEEPSKVVEVLASVGHEAAPVLSGMLAASDSGTSTLSGHVDMVDILDEMVVGAEKAVFETSTTAAQFLCTGCWSTTTVTYGAWTNTYSRPNTAGRLCIYSATRTTTKTYTGAKVFGCGACPAASTTSVTVWGYVQLQNESQSCPTYTTTNPPNITEDDPTPQN